MYDTPHIQNMCVDDLDVYSPILLQNDKNHSQTRLLSYLHLALLEQRLVRVELAEKRKE